MKKTKKDENIVLDKERLRIIALALHAVTNFLLFTNWAMMNSDELSYYYYLLFPILGSSFILATLYWFLRNCAELHEVIQKTEKRTKWQSRFRNVSALLIPPLCSGLAGATISSTQVTGMRPTTNDTSSNAGDLHSAFPNYNSVVLLHFAVVWVIAVLLIITILTFQPDDRDKAKGITYWAGNVILPAVVFLIFLPPFGPLLEFFPSSPVAEFSYLVLSGVAGGLGVLILWERVDCPSEIKNKMAIVYLIIIGGLLFCIATWEKLQIHQFIPSI